MCSSRCDSVCPLTRRRAADRCVEARASSKGGTKRRAGLVESGILDAMPTYKSRRIPRARLNDSDQIARRKADVVRRTREHALAGITRRLSAAAGKKSRYRAAVR